MANPEQLAKLKEGVGAWNMWRNESPNVEPDLREADLHRAGLAGADLTKTDLRRADLTWADLNRAHFNLSDLRDANLRRADLAGADLTWADLRDADLRETNLRAADLTGTDIRDGELAGSDLACAKFTQAMAGNTQWCNVDLSETVDLELIRHDGPSSVGLDTLVMSKGRIPDIFLRGCGLADWEIKNAELYAPALSASEIVGIQYRVHDLRVASPIRFYSAFISYSHADKAFAQALHDSLQAKGIRCWLDEKQLLPGDDIHEQIDRGIQHWDKVILCASRASLTSWWVDKDLTTAFAKEARIMKARGKKVLALVPLNLDGFLFEWENGKAEEVKARFAPDFTTWKSGGFDLPSALEPLIKALRSDDGGREPVPAPRL